MTDQDYVEKYLSVARKYGVPLKIEFSEDVDGIFDVDEVNGAVRMNGTEVAEGRLGEFLSYAVRKVVVPKAIIETPRLILRHFRDEDIDDWFEIYSDKDTCYNDGGYEPYIEKDERFYHDIKSISEQKNRFVIHSKEHDRAIGTVVFFPVPERQVDTYEMGYGVMKKYRGQGYAYEAVSALVDFLMKDLDLELLLCCSIEDNLPSVNLIKKLGFLYEGKRKKAAYHPEKGVIDLISYYLEKTTD